MKKLHAAILTAALSILAGTAVAAPAEGGSIALAIPSRTAHAPEPQPATCTPAARIDKRDVFTDGARIGARDVFTDGAHGL
jgi:hypothetical protein